LKSPLCVGLCVGERRFRGVFLQTTLPNPFSLTLKPDAQKGFFDSVSISNIPLIYFFDILEYTEVFYNLFFLLLFFRRKVTKRIVRSQGNSVRLRRNGPRVENTRMPLVGVPCFQPLLLGCAQLVNGSGQARQNSAGAKGLHDVALFWLDFSFGSFLLV
jgi:hypothetical protein